MDAIEIGEEVKLMFVTFAPLTVTLCEGGDNTSPALYALTE
jgi:hypothetical protein